MNAETDFTFWSFIWSMVILSIWIGATFGRYVGGPPRHPYRPLPEPLDHDPEDLPYRTQRWLKSQQRSTRPRRVFS